MGNKKIVGQKDTYFLECQVAEGEWGRLYRAFVCQRVHGKLYWRRYAVLEQSADEELPLPKALASQEVVETVRHGKYVYTIVSQQKIEQQPTEETPQARQPQEPEKQEEAPVAEPCDNHDETPDEEVVDDVVVEEEVVAEPDTAEATVEDAEETVSENPAIIDEDNHDEAPSKASETMEKMKSRLHDVVSNKQKFHALVIVVLFVIIAVLLVIRLNIKTNTQPLPDDLIPEEVQSEIVE